MPGTCFFIPAGFCALLGALACAAMPPVPPGGAVARREGDPDADGDGDGDGYGEGGKDGVGGDEDYEAPLLLDEVAGPGGYGTIADDRGPGTAEVAPSSAQQDAALGFLAALKIPGVVQYAVAYAFIKCVNYTLFFWLPYYLTSPALHYSKAEANAISTSFDIGSMVGGFFCGWLSDRLRKKRALASVPMLWASIPLMLLYRECGDKGAGANFVIMHVVTAIPPSTGPNILRPKRCYALMFIVAKFYMFYVPGCSSASCWGAQRRCTAPPYPQTLARTSPSRAKAARWPRSRPSSTARAPSGPPRRACFLRS